MNQYLFVSRLCVAGGGETDLSQALGWGPLSCCNDAKGQKVLLLAGDSISSRVRRVSFEPVVLESTQTPSLVVVDGRPF